MCTVDLPDAGSAAERRSRRRTAFDRFMVLAGLASPVATIPQVIKVFMTHSEQASGQSLITWAGYTALAGLWVVYGAMKRELPLVLGNVLGVMMYGLVAIGTLIHAGMTF